MNELNEYYKNNLTKLGKVIECDSIQIKCNGKQTNYFAINKESKQALINWIESL